MTMATCVKDLAGADGLACSQNDMELFGSLHELLGKLRQPGDFEYFKTAEARTKGSCARRLVNSAANLI